jgi:hypothetical protein
MGAAMAIDAIPTIDIPATGWRAFFDNFTRKYQGCRCDVEVLSVDLGSQPMVEHQQLWGIALEELCERPPAILIKTGDPFDGINEHWVRRPLAVREANTRPGQEADIQIESSDGVVTIVRIQRRAELTERRRPFRRRFTLSRESQSGFAALRRGQAKARGPLLWVMAGAALAGLLFARRGGSKRRVRAKAL